MRMMCWCIKRRSTSEHLCFSRLLQLHLEDSEKEDEEDAVRMKTTLGLMFLLAIGSSTRAPVHPLCDPTTEFTCEDGSCVDISGRCDRTKYDCVDGTDEFDCGIVLGDDGCGHKPADLVFVLDESGSIQALDFQEQLVFVQDVIDTFDVGADKIRIGVLTFGAVTRIIFPLGKYNEKEELKQAVAGIKQARGGTNTYLALKALREELFVRPSVHRVAVVITDGASHKKKKTLEEAKLCHDVNIQMFAIGVGEDTNPVELEAIASSPELLFHVGNYTALKSIKSLLHAKACEQITETKKGLKGRRNYFERFVY